MSGLYETTEQTMIEVQNEEHTMTNPQPGTKEWFDRKRGGPRWAWQDARGLWFEGYMERFSDRGGTDVTYFMRRDPTGELDCISGQRCKNMRRV